MKALTLTQPWASLVAAGAKRIETRSWTTHYRGPLAIHASKGFPPEARALAVSEPFVSTLGAERFPLPLGVVVAICKLTDVVPILEGWPTQQVRPPQTNWIATGGFDRPSWWVRLMSPGGEKVLRIYDTPFGYPSGQYDMGDFTPGRLAWLLDDVKALVQPIPASGSLSLWEWDPGDALEVPA